MNMYRQNMISTLVLPSDVVQFLVDEVIAADANVLPIVSTEADKSTIGAVTIPQSHYIQFTSTNVCTYKHECK